MGFKKASGFGRYTYTDRTVTKNIDDVKGLVREVFTRRYEKNTVEDNFYYYNGKLVAFTTDFNGKRICLVSVNIPYENGVDVAVKNDVGCIEHIVVNM